MPKFKIYSRHKPTRKTEAQKTIYIKGSLKQVHKKFIGETFMEFKDFKKEFKENGGEFSCGSDESAISIKSEKHLTRKLKEAFDNAGTIPV